MSLDQLTGIGYHNGYFEESPPQFLVCGNPLQKMQSDVLGGKDQQS
jgi:hypothetical protein